MKRGEPLDIAVQARNAEAAARSVAALAEAHDVIVTHGNGPQIGLLALQAMGGPAPYPLDVLGAESEGMIGYLLARALAARLPDRPILAVLTQVEVDAGDPAFAHPTKPIGPFYPPEAWRALAAEHGWAGVEDRGQMRRVVPSPLPKRIVEREAIARLWRAGVLAICAGGGGIPVVREESGALRGIEAVVDKDRTAALLAAELGADALLLLTDVEGVYANWSKPDARLLRRLSAEDMAALALPPGSMGPKVEAAAWFARRGRAVIAALDRAAPALAGAAGTVIEP